MNDELDSTLDNEDIEEEIEEEVDKVLSALAGETAAQLPATAHRVRQPTKQPDVQVKAEHEKGVSFSHSLHVCYLTTEVVELCLNVDIGKLFLDCQLRIQIQWYFVQIISSHPDDQFPCLGGYLWSLSELFWTAQMRFWGSEFQFGLFFDVVDCDWF